MCVDTEGRSTFARASLAAIQPRCRSPALDAAPAARLQSGTDPRTLPAHATERAACATRRPRRRAGLAPRCLRRIVQMRGLE